MNSALLQSIRSSCLKQHKLLASTATRSFMLFHTSSVAQQLPDRHGTTIVCVRKAGKVCMMADGMVSQGSMIVKPNVTKLRKIQPKMDGHSATLVGFAGSTADAFTLLERLEGKLEEHPGQLARSCVELVRTVLGDCSVVSSVGFVQVALVLSYITMVITGKRLENG
jgi:ATP-dependent protease HslVU (ClpYQ) peptidase subunit